MYIQTNHTIKNPCLFDINKVCNNCTYIHNKNMIYSVLNFNLN